MIGAVLVGAAAGLHAATWGMYKDALYEGFSLRKYGRSVMVASAAALAINSRMGFDLRGAPGLVLLFGLAYVLERGLVEWHKSFVREEDQSKYFIPMAFAVRGRVVEHRATRRLAGAAYVSAIALVALGVMRLEGGHLAALHPVVQALLLGSIGGWVSACGGAWKDAPKEGFQLLKFFRSPVLAALYGLALAALTKSYLAIAFGALGFTIATIETHKKFGRPREAPGKFAGQPVRYPEMLLIRRLFLPVYVALWILILAGLGMALAGRPGGLLALRAAGTA